MRTSSKDHCEAGPPLSAGGVAGDSEATPTRGPSASQVLTVLPPGPQPWVVGGALWRHGVETGVWP